MNGSMTRQSLAVMPEIIARSKQPPPAPQMQPPPVQPTQKPPMQPPQVQQPGMQAPMPVVPTKKPVEKGEFPLKVIASIQQIYAMESQKQERLQSNMAQGMGLKPGWGGQ